MGAMTDTDTAQDTPPIAVGADRAASMIGVSRSTLYRLARAGLPYRQVGGRRLYLVDELRSWLDAQPRQATG